MVLSVEYCVQIGSNELYEQETNGCVLKQFQVKIATQKMKEIMLCYLCKKLHRDKTTVCILKEVTQTKRYTLNPFTPFRMATLKKGDNSKCW